MIGVLVATILMVGYLCWHTFHYGVPASISQTAYKLPHESLFTLLMYAIGFLTVMPMMDACKDGTEVLAFLTIAGILFVGAAPLAKHTNIAVHMTAAVVFGASSQLMIALNEPQLLSVWVVCALWLMLIKGRHWLFWIEIACVTDLLLYCL